LPREAEFVRDSGHIPLIDANPRRDQERKQELLDEQRRCKLLNHSSAEDIRYNERTTVERVNARLNDEFGEPGWYEYAEMPT
jgi:hypothetical protein